MARSRLVWILLAFAACEDPGGDAGLTNGFTRDMHEQYFPIAAGNHVITCDNCHSTFPTFQQFTCLDGGCHTQADTDPHHTGNSDYQYDSVACYGCHPWGSGDAVDHTKIFPIGSASIHAGTRCTQCHDDPANHKNVDCMHSGCHVDPDISTKHTSVGVVDAYQTVSLQCVRCHADSQVDRVASHVPFRITSRHNDCVRCHPATRTDRPYPAQDFHVPPNLDCFQGGCHDQREIDSNHAGRLGFDGTPMNCLTCHPSGAGGD